jgi:chaperone LolA
MKKITVFIITALFSLSGSGYGLTAQQLMEKTRDEYKKTKTMSLKYTCVMDWKLRNKMDKSEGILLLKKPDKYLLKTKKIQLCSDGQTFWQYSVKNKQVVIRDLIDAADAFKIEELFFNFTSDFLPKSMSLESGFYQLTLIHRKKSSQISEMIVKIDPQTRYPSWINIAYANGDETLYTISNIRVDEIISDSKFTFKIPNNVDIEDLRD